MTAINDELTGLHNRRSFMALLRRHINNANDHHNLLALLVLDIDNFAQINAASGYAAGDAVLCHLAELLRSVARKTDYVARIGDNRFALLLPSILNKGHAELAVQKIQRLLQVPIGAGDMRLTLPVTIGVALCPVNASHDEFLLRQAEIALATAKAAGLRHLNAPENQSSLALPELWDLEMALEGAIDRDEMQMHYQPQIRIDGYRVAGAEALMRWQHPSRGDVAPDIFIPLAERSGQIKKLTIWALNTALRQAGEWMTPSEPFTIAVNLPGALAVQRDLPELVENALQLWGKHGLQLVLEITERSLMDRDHAPTILSAIRALGVKISIDDFGTGYSCLAYFKNIPADELKIDKSFINGLRSNAADADITTLIIDLAHRFGLEVAAEGVKDPQTLETLESYGCDIAQGYLFGRAMCAADFQDWRDGYQPGVGPGSATQAVRSPKS